MCVPSRPAPAAASLTPRAMPLVHECGVCHVSMCHVSVSARGADWPTTHPLRGEPVACIVAVATDGSSQLVAAPIDFYWRRDMSSGVKWPRALDDACEVHQWSGWSDSKGNLGALKGVARGAKGANAQITAVYRPTTDVVRALGTQLRSTFLGSHSKRRWYAQRGYRLVLRARALTASDSDDGVTLSTLWECPVDGVASDSALDGAEPEGGTSATLMAATRSGAKGMAGGSTRRRQREARSPSRARR